MGVREEMLASLGGADSAPKFQSMEVDGWLFSNGGKWHFFRRAGADLVSLCRRHKLVGKQDLARDGWKSTAACPECLLKFRKLVDAGEVARS